MLRNKESDQQVGKIPVLLRIARTSSSRPYPVFIADERKSADKIRGPGSAAHIVNMERCSRMSMVCEPG